MSELKPCPFCGCSMRLESNRDWHRIVGDHALECAFTDSETMVVPATKEQRDIAVSDWNARAVPAGHVVVSEDLLRSIERECRRESDWNCENVPAGTNAATTRAKKMIEIANQLRALLSEQGGRNCQVFLDGCNSYDANETETSA
ncbi:Lar family restriction alleviation protein [Pseudomonas aeruginosa]|uniref:Lar family restriction alleviation protein n=1 Tax=Pseudomonas aeruginosa TaxID=287 RepID=UPI000859583F|nr:Lar family restriction alleviation protein [Pseudomonas aeruginosa]MCE2643074.1 Lar family restriction alleviation protein [Pseudomonas aeruginosa]MCF3968725.1 Lar family restriction alleviation protein [Pseudomonas aeruginosa]MCG0406088.1 Lar family restriction alleviation protein [Pseudomonas aeruginosa]MCG0419897.1 Lar family restriction alleviation protein [Pseudomonas aeruginosa]MCT2380807.1 Lar family restriction alleviation protein [Pseudomonas aeruginosa]